MELLWPLQDSGSQGSQLRAHWSKGKVSRANSGLYSNNRVQTQRVRLAGQMDYQRERRPFVVCCLILWEQKMVSVALCTENKYAMQLG